MDITDFNTRIEKIDGEPLEQAESETTIIREYIRYLIGLIDTRDERISNLEILVSGLLESQEK